MTIHPARFAPAQRSRGSGAGGVISLRAERARWFTARPRHRAHLGKQSEGLGHQDRFAGPGGCLPTVFPVLNLNSNNNNNYKVPLHQTLPFHELERNSLLKERVHRNNHG